MGSFPWEDEYHDMCYSQFYNGRPLSVALTEPFDPFEPQPLSFFDDIPYVESDFATLRRHHHHHHHHHHRHHRSRSSGQRHKRESYAVHYPNGNPNLYCFSPPCPARRPINRVTSREVLIEKIETVMIEEKQHRPPPPPPYMVSFIHAPAPPVRQLKIRHRPSSCFDLHQESTDIRHQQRENRWSKFVDERHEENFRYNYNYNLKIPERIVPIERESPPPPPPPPPRTILHDATTSTADLYIPPPPSPPKPVRPETREAGTTTAGLPKRPLCVTETQIIERFEKTEKIRCDSTSSTEGPGSKTSATKNRPLPRSYDDVELAGKQHHRTSKKTQRKDFVQRMHARNGTLTKPCNSLNLYTSADRKREKSRTIVRPTSYPREVLVDTSGIFGTPGEFSEPTTPQAVENGSTLHSRSPFYPPELL